MDVGNYGLAILLVTFIIRILLFPLTAKSYTSMKKMQKLAPKMNAIRDKYKKAKTDAAQRQKMNAELMALYQAEGYNPMSGCLADPAPAADPRRLLQRPLARRSSCGTRRSSSGSRTSRRSTTATCW